VIASRKTLRAAFRGGQFKKKCFKCGDWGHPAKFCPNKGSTGTANSNSHSRDSNNKKEDRKCHHCGKVGHIKANCWRLHGGGPNSSGGGRGSGGNRGSQNGSRETANLTYEVVLQARDVGEGWTSIFPMAYDAIDQVCTDDFVQVDHAGDEALEDDDSDPEWYESTVETAMVACGDWWETHQAYVASTKAWPDVHCQSLMANGGDTNLLLSMKSDENETIFHAQDASHTTETIDSQENKDWHLVMPSKRQVIRAQKTSQSEAKRGNPACMKQQPGSPEKHGAELQSLPHKIQDKDFM